LYTEGSKVFGKLELVAISPLVDKNAYLGIHISRNRITANLAYSHYGAGRNYILTDTVRYDEERDDISDQQFWDEYFNTLEESFNWEIVQRTGNTYSLVNSVPFSDEGKGVSGVNFALNYTLPKKIKLLSILHTYLPTAKLTTTDAKFYLKILPPIMSKLEYDELLYLDADPEKFDLYRLDLTRDKLGAVTPKLLQTKIHWDSKDHLIESINDKRLKAFASVDVENSQVVNMWANFLIRPTEKTEDPVLHDLLRSFLTVQSMTMFNNKKDVFAQFGQVGRRSLFVITGRLASLMPGRALVLGLLDGLQMRGSFDLLVDKDHRIELFGDEYSRGINAQDYIVPRSVLASSASKVFVIEVPGRKGEKRVAFTGEILSKGKKRDVFALSPELVRMKLADNSEEISENIVLTGKFVKQAYVEGLSEEINVISDLEKLPIDSVFMDARYKPVVYGPDFRANISKLKQWMGE